MTLIILFILAITFLFRSFETGLPSPIMILDELMNSKSFLLKHSFTTIIEILIGLFLRFLGVIIGILMHTYRNFEKSFYHMLLLHKLFQYLL